VIFLVSLVSCKPRRFELRRKITYLRNLINTTIGVSFVRDVILLILQLKIMDGLMK